MIVYETKDYVVQEESIPQTPESSRLEYFVDDRTGKGLRVFLSLKEAKDYIHDYLMSVACK